ncbi:Beta-lactamase peptidase family S12 [Flavobacterium cauense R2A-7]|uniref:CubicO group peptidase (Beta-lactamase class C family) n=1 Tax=Flavobacterium cauense R2A-7 TaxID=1341154 RepID=V6S7Z7_9FLAO|nr:serine hydrolase [Flavobacterium cauense]ESU20525.1 Beta-lactamase peptidase family S12 [Flavobacterium cauense R2A-7]KGO83082.1 beta-lactamase [Flavobacterium cauense R2A-7]TWI10149.1 CubicO group peptidase (beta-lactamase class C family) [Flavobacterium cauense R2A-7]
MKNKLILISLLIGFSVSAQMTAPQVDELVEKTMKTFNVPGIAVAIVKDGKVIHSKGYGVTSIITKHKVNENTLFGIASNSKAFTAAALAILADEKKLNWDDKVIQYIPDFKMYDDYVTKEFTIRDLLTHRSGLGMGAGDLMLWPEGSDFTTRDIIHNLRYLKPVSSFRTKFDYDNLLYIVAGEIIQKVSGKSWPEFVESRIMLPLQMEKSKGNWHRIPDTTNVVTPHVPLNGKLRITKQSKNSVMDAAGGIFSNVSDMSKWVIAQLNKGKYGPENKVLFSEEQHNEMWAPQTLIPANTTPPYNTHFSAYGLGWFLSDVKGYKQVTHTGGLEGMVTQVTLLPELNLGIVVLTNQQSGAAFSAITNTIKNTYLQIPYKDYVEMYSKRNQEMTGNADKATEEVWATVAKNKTVQKINLNKITGSYTDNWLGEITISEKKGNYYFTSKRSPQLSGEIFFYKDNSFAVKWFNRNMEADAFVYATYDSTGKASNLKMKPISELTDFSYDFQDLDFNRNK